MVVQFSLRSAAADDDDDDDDEPVGVARSGRDKIRRKYCKIEKIKAIHLK